MPIDPAAVDRLLSWDGIGRSIDRRIANFVAQAVTHAPYRPDNATGEHLALAIDAVRMPDEGARLIARVGTHPGSHQRGYAYIVHEGSRPHPIRPRAPRKSLAFRVAGRLVIAQRVNHPGTTPDPFLTRWIRELV